MRFNYLSVLFFSFLIVGCSHSEDFEGTKRSGEGDKILVNLTPTEAMSVAFDNPKELSKNEIIEMVSGFAQSNSSTRSFNTQQKVLVNREFTLDLPQNNASTRSSVDVEKIKFCVTDIINNSQDDALNGFAVACMDERYPAVLAYVEQGNYDNIPGSPAELMLLRAQAVALSYIAEVNDLKAMYHDQTIEKICKTLDIHESDFNYDQVKKSIYVQRIPNEEIDTRSVVFENPGGSIMGQMGPLCGTTRIIQGWPCNQFIDLVDVGKHGAVWQLEQHNGRYPAGCVNVALATMCSFLKPNIYCPELNRNINWNNVFNTYFNPFALYSNASDPNTPHAIEVARLLKTISVGTKTKFDAAGGSTSTTNAATYMRSIGINMSNSTVAMSYLNIRPSLNYMGLVYATGNGRQVQTKGEGISGGHAWVIDGYQIRSRVTRQELQSYNCYVNCNFGWIEPERENPYYRPTPANGWYLTDYNGSVTFDLTRQWGSVYDVNLQCIVNIKK